MVIERKNKLPFILFFMCYLLKYQLTWILTTIFITYIPDYFDGGDWSLLEYTFSWFRDMTLACCFVFMPVIAPYVYYYQCFNMIRKIDIDEKRKTLKIDYTKFFFFEKSKEYLLDDPTFCCTIAKTKHNLIAGLFFPHFNISIGFGGSTDKSPWTLLLKDRCGWKSEQVTEIYEILKEYCPHDDQESN